MKNKSNEFEYFFWFYLLDCHFWQSFLPFCCDPLPFSQPYSSFYCQFVCLPLLHVNTKKINQKQRPKSIITLRNHYEREMTRVMPMEKNVTTREGDAVTPPKAANGNNAVPHDEGSTKGASVTGCCVALLWGNLN